MIQSAASTSHYPEAMKMIKWGVHIECGEEAQVKIERWHRVKGHDIIEIKGIQFDLKIYLLQQLKTPGCTSQCGLNL